MYLSLTSSGPDCAVRESIDLPVLDETATCSIYPSQGVIQFETGGWPISSGLTRLAIFSLGRLSVFVSPASLSLLASYIASAFFF